MRTHAQHKNLTCTCKNGVADANTTANTSARATSTTTATAHVNAHANAHAKACTKCNVKYKIKCKIKKCILLFRITMLLQYFLFSYVIALNFSKCLINYCLFVILNFFSLFLRPDTRPSVRQSCNITLAYAQHRCS